MEVIVHAKNLKAQVGALQGILARKETVPVLSKIKIDAHESGDLVMTATDLDVSLVIGQETDVLQAGSICLNGKKLGLIAGNLPNEPVHLKLDAAGEKVEFKAGRFSSKLSGTESEQFPEIVRSNGEWLKIPAGIFYEGLKHTIFAVSPDSSRFAIGGVLLLIEEAGLKLISTDGHRLCFFRTLFSGGGKGNFRCLIPLKAARELKNLLADELRSNSKSEISVRKGGQIEFQIGNKLMTARELSGDFPNWEMAVPKEFMAFAEVNAAQFGDALSRVSLMADDTHHRVEFVFSPDGRVLLQSESAEKGNSIEEIGCTFQFFDRSESAGEDVLEHIKMAFNIRYLADFLSIHPKNKEDQRVVLKFSSPHGPCELTFEGQERIFSYILVPLKS